MASSATSAVSFIDPEKPAKYPVHLGQGLRERQEPDKRFWNVKYNHKPRLQSPATRNVRLDSSSSPSLNISDIDPEGKNSEKYTYTGNKRSPTDSYALVFDRQSKSFTLEPLAASYSLNVSSNPSDKSHTALTSQYGDATSEAANPAAAAVNCTEPENDEESDLFGGDGALDPKNPFDFRHYSAGLPEMQDTRPMSTVGSPAASPLHVSQNNGVGLGISNGGSSPLAPANSTKPGTTSNLAVSAAGDKDKTAPRPLQQLSSPMVGATISRKRKAPDIFAKGNTRKPVRKRASPPATTNPAAAKNATSASPEPLALSKPEHPKPLQSPSPPVTSSATDDLLIIEDDDAGPTNRSAYASTPPSVRPRSLRDLATSRDASPAAAVRPSAGNAARGFLGRPRVGSGAASVRTDADVDTDLDIGSPRWDAGKDEETNDARGSGPEVGVEADEDDDIQSHDGGQGDGDDEDDELTRAIAEAIQASDPEPEPDAAPQRRVEEEEEESEEE